MVKPTTSVAIAIVTLLQAGLLAAEKSVTITPSTKGDSNSSWGGGFTTWNAENVRLADVLPKLYPDTVWPAADISALPDGRFDIKIVGYSTREPAAFEALAAEIKKQFSTDVSVIEEERDGYALSLPNADKLTKADSEEGYSMMTTLKGWSIKAATLKEIANWLQKELDAPVETKDAAEARYSFELEVSPFKPEDLPAAIEKLGFVVAKGKSKVKVLKVVKAAGSGPQD